MDLIKKPTIKTHSEAEQKISDMKEVKQQEQSAESKPVVTVPKQTATFLNKLIKWPIYLLVFLMPIFFLPFSYEIIEYNKQILLWVLAGIAFVAWICKMAFVDKEIRFKKNLVSLGVLIFLAANVIIFILSKDKYASLWGYFGRYSDSLVGLTALSAFYFVIVNNKRIFFPALSEGGTKGGCVPESGRGDFSLINTFLFSSFIAEIILIGSIFGLWSKLCGGNIPQFCKLVSDMNFNTFASFKEGAAMFITIILTIIIAKSSKLPLLPEEGVGGGAISSKAQIKKPILSIKNQISLFLYFFISLFLLILLNFKPAFIVLSIMMLALMVSLIYSRLSQKSSKPANIILPLAVAIIASLFIFNISGIENFKFLDRAKNIPSEARLSAKDSLAITGNLLKKEFLFGSGQGNFIYSFSKFNPESFSKSSFWALRFNKANNYILELISTTGLLGMLAWIVLVGMAIIPLLTKEGVGGGLIPDPLIFGFGAVVLSFFFYSSTTLLLFAFWLFLSVETLQCNVSTSVDDEVIVKNIFNKFPELLLILDFAAIAALALFGGVALSAGKKYAANIEYAKSVSANVGAENLLPLQLLQKAQKLDPKNALYPIALANVQFTQLKDEMDKNPADQSADQITKLAGKVVDNAKLATDLSPNSVSAWELRGAVYRDIYLVAGDAEKFMLEAFQKAAELDPNNPAILTELGKAYVLNNNNAEAEKDFTKALELNSNYEEAEVQLALVKDKLGKATEAIGDLELIIDRNPKDSRLKFELGKIEYNKGDIDKAMQHFQEAIAISPNYSNAIYSLALCYIKKDNKIEALKQMNKVLELNPGRKDIEEKIAEMEGNKEIKK